MLIMMSALETLSTSITDENIEVVKEIIMENHRINIRKVTGDIAMSVGSSHTIFIIF